MSGDEKDSTTNDQGLLNLNHVKIKNQDITKYNLVLGFHIRVYKLYRRTVFLDSVDINSTLLDGNFLLDERDSYGPVGTVDWSLRFS